ncbi:MAG: 2-oxo acid dehydrogenase subunit E2, partial [Acidimicrobiia bacterium]|nr:2-oxo acid dehydrogenase subunit E2 [Acidimicrobiia bacterium]
MPTEVLMPVITEPGDDAVVTAWFVDESSPVRTGQLIAEVQAEKVSAEVTAPSDGYVGGLAGINDPVLQGAPICVIADEPIDAATPAPVAASAVAAAAASPEGRIVASPSAKRVARDLGIDLAAVTGSGPRGRITEADVRGAAEPAAAAEPMTGLRSVIARNLRRSAAETAPVTLTTTVDVTATTGTRLTPWVVHTTAVALREHPELNGTRDGDAFAPAETAHVALAIQTDDGLVAPVVRDVAAKTVDEIGLEIGELAARARAGEL